SRRGLSRADEQGGVRGHSSGGQVFGGLRHGNEPAGAFSVQHRGERRKAAGGRVARRGRCAQPELHLRPRAVSRIAGGAAVEPKTDFAARPKQSGGGGVDWSGQDWLRHSRHARAGAGWAHRIARLLPAGELGRGILVEAGVGRNAGFGGTVTKAAPDIYTGGWS